jgi:hypothetical protein
MEGSANNYTIYTLPNNNVMDNSYLSIQVTGYDNNVYSTRSACDL